MFIVILLSVLSLSFSQPAVEYRLLKDFLETKDVGTGLFLLDNYPESAFVDELRVELAEALLSKGEKDRAVSVLREVNLNNLRDDYGERAVKLWESLGLDRREILLRFPEHALHLMESTELSEGDRSKIAQRLLTKGLYKELLEFTQECLYRGIALFRLRSYRESVETLKACEGERAGIYELLARIKLKEDKELEELVQRRDSPKVYFKYAKHLLSEGKHLKARKYFIKSGYTYDSLFYIALIDYMRGKLMLAYENFSQAYRLAQGNIEKAKVLFWKFKTLKSMGIEDLANHMLAKASELTGFYGVVAKLMLGNGVYEKVDIGYSPSEAKLGKWLEEIYNLGFPYYMRLEAYNRVQDISPEDVIYILRFDPYLAIKLSVKAFGVNSDIFRYVSFPTPFEPLVERASEDFGVEKALIYAVMRQESLFDMFAVSRSRAMGLMQLIERTAKWKAEKLGITYEDVFEPEVNIRLGTAYLSYLFRYWKGDMVRVIASYNAGQGNVKRWDRSEDDYLFIENIPYDETRKYVRRVLWFYYIYKEKLSEPSR